MTYLSDRRSKRNRFIYQLTGIVLLGCTVIFWVHIRLFLSPVMFSLSNGLFSIKITIADTYNSFHSWFSTKSTLENTINLLEAENNAMENEIAKKDALIASYDNVYKTNTTVTASTLEVFPLFSPLASLYGSFLISKGFSSEIVEGLIVYGSGYIPLGKVTKVGTHTSEVQLLSASGNELEGIVVGSSTDKVILRLTGMGGGDYSALLPKEVEIELGAVVMWKENPKMKLGTVVLIDNTPQAIAQKLLIRGTYSPTNAPQLYIDLP